MTTATRLPVPWPLPGHERVLLRPPAATDVPQLVAACTDPDVQAFTRVPHPYDEGAARGFVALAQEVHAAGEGVVVVLVEGATLLGAASVGVDRRDHTGEVGYWLVPAGRGRGLATAAAREVVRFALAELGVRCVRLFAIDGNDGSHAVARRLGFTRVGVFRDGATIGPTGAVDNPRGDLVAYDLLPGELR